MGKLKNYVEQHVLENMGKILANTNVCLCEDCTLDIAAIALNHLPPKYFVSEKGELFSRADSLYNQFEIDVSSAVLKAAAMVKKNPRHSLTGIKKNPRIIIDNNPKL